MKIYVTKYALTSGIFSTEAEVNPDGWHGYAIGYVEVNGARLKRLYKPRDFKTGRFSAIVKAADMRDKKIASLEKQIEKLRAMTFEVEE
jgi:hypothetical protein